MITWCFHTLYGSSRTYGASTYFCNPPEDAESGKANILEAIFGIFFFLAAINGIFIDYHRLIAQIDSWNLFVGFNRLLEVQK